MFKQTIRQFSSSARRMNVAKFTGIGRIGNDLTLQEANSGRKYIKYGLAVNGPKDHTSWYNIVVFDESNINFMTNYLTKGARVYVEADMSMQSFTTEADETRRSLNLVQREIRSLGGKQRQEEQA